MGAKSRMITPVYQNKTNYEKYFYLVNLKIQSRNNANNKQPRVTSIQTLNDFRLCIFKEKNTETTVVNTAATI